MKSLSIVSIKKQARAVRDAFLYFVFPTHCLHCKQSLVGARELLCSECSPWIERYPASECFSHQGISVEPEGPALSLVQARTGYAHKEIARTMAAFMLLQFFDLGWKRPDWIVPAPGDPFNLHLALALKVLWQDPPVAPEAGRRSRHTVLSDQVLLQVEAFWREKPQKSLPFSCLEETAPREIFFLSFC